MVFFSQPQEGCKLKKLTDREIIWPNATNTTFIMV